MNYRQLEAFLMTMRTGSVTAAAKALFISQPSVSRLLRELEDSVGICLFHHQKGRFCPTREADLLFEEVERSFVGLSAIQKAASQINELSFGPLRIGCSLAPSLKLLPDAICCFVQQHPKTNISLTMRSSQRISEWVVSNQMDIGIIIAYHHYPSISLFDKIVTHFVAVMPADHHLAVLKQLSWEDMKDETLISIQREYLLSQTRDPELKQLMEKRVRFETEQCFMACSLVQRGLGIALVDIFTASHFLDLGLIARNIEAKIPFELQIIHAEHRKPSLAAEQFFPILMQKIEHIYSMF
jgi:DNA-binding transcriptional LysR family regulator